MCRVRLFFMELCIIVNKQDKKVSGEQDFEISKNGLIKKYTGAETAVVIPQEICKIAVRSIGKYAFTRKGLASIVIQNGVTRIGYGAFSHNQLTKAAIPDSVREIGMGAFCGNQLAGITIPNSVTQIVREAFAGNQLTAVVIPHSVTKIDVWAFTDNRLKSITILGTVSLPRKSKYSSSAFDNGFDDFYKSNNKKSGTYLFDGTNWEYQR